MDAGAGEAYVQGPSPASPDHMTETLVDRSAVKRSLQTFAVYLKVETPWTGGERGVLPIHGTQGLGPRNTEDPLFTDRHSDGGPEEVEEVRPRIDKDTVFRRQDQRAVVLPVIRPKTLIPHHNNSPLPQDLWPARSHPHLLGFSDQGFDFPDQQPERLHRDRTRQW